MVAIAVLVIALLAIVTAEIHTIATATPAQRSWMIPDALGIFCDSIMPAAIALVVCSRRRFALILGFTTLYITTYAALSAAGGYRWSQSGNLRYATGLSVTNEVIWQPRGVYWAPFVDVSGKQTSRCTELGRFYSPLIRIDRRWWHPTQKLF